MKENKRDKNTGIVEGRVSVCTLASLLKFFDNNNVQVNTKSALLNEALETFFGVLIENNMVEPVTDIEDAIEILDRLSTKRDVRVSRNLLKAILMQRSEEINAENLRAICEEGVRKFEEMMNSGADVERAEGIVQLSEEAQKVPDYSFIPSGIVATEEEKDE